MKLFEDAIVAMMNSAGASLPILKSTVIRRVLCPASPANKGSKDI